MILRLAHRLVALDAEGGEVLADAGERALVEEAGEIVGSVGQKLAAADADEQREELALDRLRRGRGGRPAQIGAMTAEDTLPALELPERIEQGHIG